MAALEACYRVFGARVFALCRRLVGRDLAEDAAQEVFVKVFEHAASFRGGARFSTWIHQVAVNHCLKRLERERLRRTLELPAAVCSRDTEDGLSAVDDRDQVERWIAALPPDQRAVLVLRELEGLDYAAIGSALGIPVGTVMSRLHRARTKLIELERAAAERSRTLGTIPT